MTQANSLALRHHLVVHGAGAAVAAVASAGQAAGGHPAVRAAAGRSEVLGAGAGLAQGRLRH